FVLADERGLLAFLERAPNADHSGPLQDVFTLIQNNQRIVAGIHTPPELRNVARQMEKGVGKDMAAPAFSAQTMILQADGALKGELRLRYADAAQAERARKLIEAVVNRAPDLLKDHKVAGNVNPLGAILHEKALAVLPSLAIDVKDNTLTIATGTKGKEQ